MRPKQKGRRIAWNVQIEVCRWRALKFLRNGITTDQAEQCGLYIRGVDQKRAAGKKSRKSSKGHRYMNT